MPPSGMVIQTDSESTEKWWRPSFAGLIVGLLAVIAFNMGPRGQAVLWIAMAAFNFSSTIMMWKRTRLLFSTISLAVFTAGCLFFALLGLSGRTFAASATLYFAPLAIILVIGFGCRLVQKKTTPEAWRELIATEKARQTLWNRLTGRTIPDLRRLSRS